MEIWNLNLVLPRSGFSRTDHVLWHSSNDSLKEWEYTRNLHVASDHQCMILQLKTQVFVPMEKQTSPCLRFNLRPLELPAKSKLLNQHFDLHTGEFLLSMLQHTMDLLSRATSDEQQALVDSLDQFLVTGIQASARIVLGEYEVTEVKSAPDRSSLILEESPSHAKSIQCFKRSHRRMGARKLESKTNQCPLEEATVYWTRAFTSLTPVELIRPPQPLLPGERPDRTDNPSTFFSALTNARIKKAIRKYPAFKAPGPDGISCRLLKCLLKSKTFVKVLTALFQLFAGFSITPSSWNESITLLIPKSGTLEPTLARPIALTCVLRRIFESIALATWLADKADWMALHPCQAGFRRGFSTLTHILLRHQVSKTAAGKIQIFLDFQDAYNRVDFSTLSNILHSRGCPPSTLSLLFSLSFSSPSTRLVVNHRLSPVIRRSRGLMQGSPLSCMMFNIYIDSLLHELNPASSPLRSFGFADDINVGCRNREEATQMIEIVTDWARRHHMQLNVNKCGVIGLQQGAPLFIGNVPVPQPESYKYLGIPCSASGLEWKKFIDNATTKADGLLRQLSDVGGNWSPFVKLSIYKTFVRPLTDYGLAIIPSCSDEIVNYALQKLNESHDRALQWSFGTFRASLNRRLLESMTAIAHPSRRMAELAARFSDHIGSASVENPITIQVAAMSNKLQFHKLIWRCARTHPLRQRYSREVSSIPQDLRPTFSEWLRTDRIKWIDSQTPISILSRYIRGPSCRRGASQTDACLSLDRHTQLVAVLWRRNRLFVNPTCTICMQSLNRGHLQNCPSLNNCHAFAEEKKQPLSSDELASILKAENDKLRREGISQPTFNALDFFLNERRWRSFRFWVRRVSDAVENFSYAALIARMPV